MKNYFILLFSIVFLALPLSAVERWVDLDTELRTEWVVNRVQDGWKVEDGGDPRGVNKDFSFVQGVSSAEPSGWRGEIEEVFLLNLAARASSRLSFDIGYEAVGNYADRLWQPISDRKRMELAGDTFKWTRGNIVYRSDTITLRGFKGVGHNSWVNTDIDMFNFYPEQFEVDRYRRVSGRILPRGGSAELGSARTGRLTYVTGEELIWGFGPSHYVKYNKRLGTTETTLFYKREEISYGKPHEKLDAWQLASRMYLPGRSKLTAGLIFQPFRLGESYEYVEDVRPGTGILGSDYKIRSNRIDAYDAWGEAVEVIFHPRPVIDTLTVGFRHLGLVAGNKDEFLVRTKRKFLSKQLTASLGFTGIRPLRGPMPLLKDQAGSILSSPRGIDSPFRVTEDPQLGEEWGNREKNIIDLIAVYDPTPITWFFRWKDNVVENWNINPAENAPVAAAFQLRFIEYPGTTDNVPYFNEQGKLTFVPAHFTGLPPTKGYLPSAKILSVVNLCKNYRILFGIGGGQIPASTVLADEKGKNYTNYFTSEISVRRGPASIGFSYERDAWGPEDFHRGFGEIIDRLFRSFAGYDFGDIAYVKTEYIHARRIENLTDTFSLGSFDEIRFLFGIRFGVLALIDQRKPVATIKKRGPEARLVIDEYVFSPDGDGLDDSVKIWLEVVSGGIASWQVTIVDESERIIYVYGGYGAPPDHIEWSGIDQDFDATVAEGTYTVNFQVNDIREQSGFALPVEIKVQY